MVGQLNEVVDAVKKISGGNLRINDVTIRSADEIGTLAEKVNDMKYRLKNLLTKIAECSERVAASSEELTAGTVEQESTIQLLEDRIQNKSTPQF